MKENLKIPSELLEPAILKKCVKDVSFFIKIYQFLDTRKFKDKSFFSDKKYQKIFNTFCLIFEKIQKFPREKDVLFVIDKTETDAEIKLYINSLISKLYDEELDFSDEVVETETISFIKEARVYEAFLKSQGHFESGSYSKIVGEMEEAIRVNFDKDLGVEIMDDSIIDKINSVYSTEVISTGYSNLDQALGGGLVKKTLTILGSPPAGGKSLFLGMLAINAYLQGKKVLFYTLEMSKENLASRFYSNIFDKVKSEIINDPEGIKKNIKDFDPKGGSLIIKEYPSSTANCNDFLAHMNDLKVYKNWEPDIIFVDYLLITAANDKSLSQSDSYQYFKSVTIELRNIAKIKDVPLVTATQLNRSSQQEGKIGTKGTVTSQQLSESRAILDTADYLFTIIQTERDKINNIYCLYGDKLRNEMNGKRLYFKMDYIHMRASVIDSPK